MTVWLLHLYRQQQLFLTGKSTKAREKDQFDSYPTADRPGEEENRRSWKNNVHEKVLLHSSTRGKQKETGEADRRETETFHIRQFRPLTVEH